MASMSITFLGTGCMVPTKDRNHLALALEYNGSVFLFDCGEATQLQIKKFKVPIGKIKKIFLSHFHGDHVLGLPGLIQTLSNTQGVEKIEIHGPIGAKTFVDHMLKCSIFDSKIPITVDEHIVKKGEVKTIIDNANYSIKCAPLNHSVPCLGYTFEEKSVINIDKEKAKELGLEQSPLLARAKMGLDIEYNNKKIKYEDLTYVKPGKKISFIFDTRPCHEITLLTQDSDVLVMEATYIFEKHGAKAEEYDHMSAKETAQIAKDNNIKTLYITHFSQRYTDIKEIEQEAKETFENTVVTYDGFIAKIR